MHKRSLKRKKKNKKNLTCTEGKYKTHIRINYEGLFIINSKLLLILTLIIAIAALVMIIVAFNEAAENFEKTLTRISHKFLVYIKAIKTLKSYGFQ